MRVLYLTDSLSDLDGVGRYTMRLVASMEKLAPDLEIEILLARKHRPTSKQVPAHWKVTVALPPDYFFYMSPPRFWASLAHSGWKTWRAARRADVVHAIKDYPHNLLGWLAARAAGVPCIATAHGTYTVQPLLSERHRKLALRAYSGFSSMISVSGYTRRRILECVPPGTMDPARIHVIPNCVDAEHYIEARGPKIGPRPWQGRAYTLGIGEIKERKGHHLALAAWCRVAARHPELHHYVVGRPSGDGYERSLHEMVAAAGLSARVHFLGNIEEDEKIDLLQGAVAFVHTPVTAADGGFEGFGIVYLEASASGTACIGTLGCGAEDAILHGETGLLVPQTVDAVEGALETLVADEETRRRMGSAGRRHASRASWTENASKVLAIYREACA